MLAVTSTELRVGGYREEKGLAGSDQWYRRQCGQQSYELPAAEMFLQHDSCQQYCDRRVERRDDYGFVEAAVLAGEDEQRDADDIETAGQSTEDGGGTVELHWRSG